MIKNIFLLIMMFPIVAFGQHRYCGFDHAREKLETEFPIEKEMRLQAEEELKTSVLGRFSNGNIVEMSNDVGGAYTGRIYEIPVVVHVIESKSPSNAYLSLTDAQIEQWIANANAMYSTTYGNGFYSEGMGPDGGTVMPFKLVLAKRTPQCLPTNGIIRYNGSSIAGYDDDGVNSGSGTIGVDQEDIKALAPHWPENSYFNIYLVIGFDGDIANYGLMGWAYMPTVSLDNYESFMKVATVTNANDSTLVHEFGHALGLYHPFNGARSDGGECPKNDNCLEDNDKVCDTEPTQSLLNTFPVPSNSAINPCTNDTYKGVQYNIMNYTNDNRKFTPGQRERALALFLRHRGVLTTSLGATPPPDNYTHSDLLSTAASCSPQNRTNLNNVDIGISSVKLRNIDNPSTIDREMYVDYSLHTCLSNKVYTDIVLDPNEKNEISIDGGGLNQRFISIWIDYNDNGTFESSEHIGTKVVRSTDNNFTMDIKNIPDTAVKNKYLRMRIRGDAGRLGPCDDLLYGQVEDYAVRIVDKVENTPINNGDAVIRGVGINTEIPQATLDVREVENPPVDQPQGVIFPSFTTDERNTFDKSEIKEGTMIYNKTMKCIEIYKEGSWHCL